MRTIVLLHMHVICNDFENLSFSMVYILALCQHDLLTQHKNMVKPRYSGNDEQQPFILPLVLPI